MVFCWVPGLWDLPFRGVAACVPQVREQGRGGSADVGAVTRVLVAEDDEVEIGCAWCPGAARSASAELACPGACRWLMEMDLELLGDGVEKVEKEPSEMEKRTRSPRVPFLPRYPLARGVPRGVVVGAFSVGLCSQPGLGEPAP